MPQVASGTKDIFTTVLTDRKLEHQLLRNLYAALPHFATTVDLPLVLQLVRRKDFYTANTQEGRTHRIAILHALQKLLLEFKQAAISSTSVPSLPTTTEEPSASPSTSGDLPDIAIASKTLWSVIETFFSNLSASSALGADPQAVKVLFETTLDAAAKPVVSDVDGDNVLWAALNTTAQFNASLPPVRFLRFVVWYSCVSVACSTSSLDRSQRDKIVQVQRPLKTKMMTANLTGILPVTKTMVILDRRMVPEPKLLSNLRKSC